MARKSTKVVPPVEDATPIEDVATTTVQPSADPDADEAARKYAEFLATGRPAFDHTAQFGLDPDAKPAQIEPPQIEHPVDVTHDLAVVERPAAHGTYEVEIQYTLPGYFTRTYTVDATDPADAIVVATTQVLADEPRAEATTALRALLISPPDEVNAAE